MTLDIENRKTIKNVNLTKGWFFKSLRKLINLLQIDQGKKKDHELLISRMTKGSSL